MACSSNGSGIRSYVSAFRSLLRMRHVLMHEVLIPVCVIHRCSCSHLRHPGGSYSDVWFDFCRGPKLRNPPNGTFFELSTTFGEKQCILGPWTWIWEQVQMLRSYGPVRRSLLCRTLDPLLRRYNLPWWPFPVALDAVRATFPRTQ